MSVSDKLALDANYKHWVDTRGVGIKSGQFNYYTAENFLKSFPVGDSEILSGIVDRPKDVGVDGFYFFANKKYVFDDTELEPIQEEMFHEQRLVLVRRLSMMRILARRTKASTVAA